jgi:HTH-type transcriptional regulator/antitoxin HipB
MRIPAHLGPILRGYRSEFKLTQKAVGARAGLAQNALSGIEANPGPTSLNQIFKVLRALNLELAVRARRTPKSASEW